MTPARQIVELRPTLSDAGKPWDTLDPFRRPVQTPLQSTMSGRHRQILARVRQISASLEKSALTWLCVELKCAPVKLCVPGSRLNIFHFRRRRPGGRTCKPNAEGNRIKRCVARTATRGAERRQRRQEGKPVRAPSADCSNDRLSCTSATTTGPERRRPAPSCDNRPKHVTSTRRRT